MCIILLYITLVDSSDKKSDRRLTWDVTQVRRVWCCCAVQCTCRRWCCWCWCCCAMYMLTLLNKRRRWSSTTFVAAATVKEYSVHNTGHCCHWRVTRRPTAALMVRSLLQHHDHHDHHHDHHHQWFIIKLITFIIIITLIFRILANSSEYWHNIIT